MVKRQFIISKENKTVELIEEDLEKIDGEGGTTSSLRKTIQVVCRDCGYVFDEYLSGRPSPRASGTVFCPTCKKMYILQQEKNNKFNL